MVSLERLAVPSHIARTHGEAEQRNARAQTPVDLTGTEYALLCHLAADPRRVFTKHENVWGVSYRLAPIDPREIAESAT